jgi:hypothetical protein
MRVFRIKSDFGFQSLFPYDPAVSDSGAEIVKADVLMGRTAPRLSTWTPMRLYTQEQGKPLGDFAKVWGFGCFAINARAHQLIEPILRSYCEFLPFQPFMSQVFYRLNVLQRVDCLDHHRTVEKSRGGEILEYHFDSQRLTFPNLFMLSTGPALFTVDGWNDEHREFKSIVEDEGLTGLKFEEVWIGGGPPIRLKPFAEKLRSD